MRLLSVAPCIMTGMSEMYEEKTEEMKRTSLYPQAPSCCYSQCQVLSTGIISSFLSFTTMIMSMVLLVTDNSWNMVMQKAQIWLEENKWDIKVCKSQEK